MQKIGQQNPRIRYCPEYAYTDGPDCCLLAKHYGLEMDLWQSNTLNDWLGRDNNDKLVAISCGLSVSRQNGKNAALEAREIYGLTVLGDTILHTAHEVRTAREAFLRLCQYFENKRKYPDLYKICKSIRKANGQEMIECEWTDEDGEIINSKIMFMARSRGAARGFSVDMVVFDEAQELTHEQIEAMLPTLSASKKEIQIIYTGTPPKEAGKGEVFSNVRNSALKKLDDTLCWHEWSVEEIGDVSDVERWYETNPALGIRIKEERTRKELYTMSAAGFARERLGWWSKTIASAVIPIKSSQWDNCAEDYPLNDGICCFGVKFGTTGTECAVSVCCKTVDEEKVANYHIELIMYIIDQKSLEHILSFLEDVGKKAALTIIDSKTFAEDIRKRIIDRGVSKSAIITAKTNDITDACAWFTSSVNSDNGDITHFKNKGQKKLDDAAKYCTKREVGKDGRFAFEDSKRGSSVILESAALAYYASRTTKRNPSRKLSVKCY